MNNTHPYNQSYGVAYDEGDTSLERIPYEYVPSLTDIKHTVMEGENIFSIASAYYGDSGLWYVIADVNLLYNPAEELTPGLEITIPNG